MKKRFALFALLMACVPTEAEKDLRGGIAVTFAPSEATAGAPFMTNDGWTVTIERTALRATATALPSEAGNYGGGGSSYPRILDPRFVCELRVTGLLPGPVAVTVQLQTTDPRYLDDREETEVCAVDAATTRRFKTFSDDTLITPDLLADDYALRYGGSAPSVYVKGAAVKGGRVLRFDLALAVGSNSLSADSFDGDGIYSPSDGAGTEGVVVVPNQGAPAHFEVHFESIFANGIDSMAAADTNADGQITADELRAATLPCASTNPYGDDEDDVGDDDDDDNCRTLLDQLVIQASTVLGESSSVKR